MRDLIQPFRKALAALVRPGETVLVAVSGGADSLALLDLTDRVRESLDLHLVVVHLDHGWRTGSSEDAAFVVHAAEARGLRSVVERLDTRADPTEAAGRAARLALYARVTRIYGARGVLLGHTVDDQCETVLMHLLRGSGTLGASGMRAEAEISVEGVALRLLRPLLGFRRADLRAYCLTRGMSPRDDPSNIDPRYLRNRIRRELIPLVEELAPGGPDALVRLAETAAADADLIDDLVAETWSAVVISGEEAIVVDRAAFRRQHLALQRALLRRCAARLLGPAPDLAWERLEAAREALVGGRGGAVIEWPARVTLRIVGRRGIFAREPAS